MSLTEGLSVHKEYNYVLLQDNIILNNFFSAIIYFMTFKTPYAAMGYIGFVVGVIVRRRDYYKEWNSKERNACFYTNAAITFALFVTFLTLVCTNTVANIVDIWTVCIPICCYMFALVVYGALVYYNKIKNQLTYKDLNTYSEIVMWPFMIILLILYLTFKYAQVNSSVSNAFFSICLLFIIINSSFILSKMYNCAQATKGYIATSIVAILSIVYVIIASRYGFNNVYKFNRLIN